MFVVPISGARAASSPPDRNLAIGASSRSVLPLVDGSYRYLNRRLPTPRNAVDPGIFVPEWDDGRIAVGNGESESHWVHDDLRVTAMAIEDTRTHAITVVVSSDLYMIFRVDADGIRTKAAALVPPGDASRMKVIVASTHNHHGPDTAFDVNHDWYEHMTDQTAAAIADAVARREPATLAAATGQHWFGTRDSTDPEVYDPTLQVLQAKNRKGKVIATAVQWNDHPETTLGYSPPTAAIADDCVQLGRTGDACTAEGRYFTADYPGAMRRDLTQKYGGEVLYFNGPLGRARHSTRRRRLGGHAEGATREPARRAGRRAGSGRRYRLHRAELPSRGGHRRAVVGGRGAVARARRQPHRHSHDLRDPAVHDPAHQLRFPRPARGRSRDGPQSARARARTTPRVSERADRLFDVHARTTTHPHTTTSSTSTTASATISRAPWST